MNIVLEGIEAAGKTTLAEKLMRKYGMSIMHSTSKTRNDFTYHLDLLNFRENTVFDRFHIGEMIYPIIYNRPGKLTEEEWNKINKQIIDNNDLFIVFVCSNMSIIEQRLVERGEEDQIPLLAQQNDLFTMRANLIKEQYNYKNFYIIDIAEENSYDRLDAWIDTHWGKKNINTVYREVARDLIEKGHVMETKNLRGNTKELCNYELIITDLDSEYVSLKSGGTNLTYLAAELLWYWSARNDVAFIDKFAKLWAKVSDDGIHANSAYGFILQKKHGFNQIEKMIELLKFDPYSRRAIININIPNENVIETKDEPCTICLNYQIREGKLHATTVMRSNDFRFGALNDLGFFISLQKYIAKRLNVPVGTYHHYCMSLHFYDRDFEFFKAVAYGTLETSGEKLNIELLLNHKEELVTWVDTEFTSKQDFKQKLIDLGIIYYD